MTIAFAGAGAGAVRDVYLEEDAVIKPGRPDPRCTGAFCAFWVLLGLGLPYTSDNHHFSHNLFAYRLVR